MYESDYPGEEAVEVDEHRLVKWFALNTVTGLSMPSATKEEMALLSLLSWGGETVDCMIRLPVLRDLRNAIDEILETVDG